MKNVFIHTYTHTHAHRKYKTDLKYNIDIIPFFEERVQYTPKQVCYKTFPILFSISNVIIYTR